MKTPAKLTLFLFLCTLAGATFLQAADPAEVTIELPKFVVTAKPFGLIPIGAFVRPTDASEKIVASIRVAPLSNGLTPTECNLQDGETVVAINGKPVRGMKFEELKEFWLYGQIGESVRLVLHGAGRENESIYREIVVKRKRWPKLPEIGNQKPAEPAKQKQ